MRWKLLVITSLVLAFVGCGLWCAVTILLFDSARNLARHDWLLLASMLVPLGFTIFAGVFVYRHTARRRKTQAAITVLLTLLVALGAYLAASQLFPNKLVIPRTYEGRHAR